MKTVSPERHLPSHENPSNAPPPLGAYSQLSIVPPGWSIIVLAGQVGIDEAGKIPPDPIEQYANALRNVVTLLAARGLTPRHIIKLNSWFVDSVDLRDVSRTRQDILGVARPAATLAYVVGLVDPLYRVEVEAWAAAPALNT